MCFRTVFIQKTAMARFKANAYPIPAICFVRCGEPSPDARIFFERVNHTTQPLPYPAPSCLVQACKRETLASSSAVGLQSLFIKSNHGFGEKSPWLKEIAAIDRKIIADFRVQQTDTAFDTAGTPPQIAESVQLATWSEDQLEFERIEIKTRTTCQLDIHVDGCNRYSSEKFVTSLIFN